MLLFSGYQRHLPRPRVHRRNNMTNSRNNNSSKLTSLANAFFKAPCTFFFGMSFSVLDDLPLPKKEIRDFWPDLGGIIVWCVWSSWRGVSLVTTLLRRSRRSVAFDYSIDKRRLSSGEATEKLQWHWVYVGSSVVEWGHGFASCHCCARFAPIIVSLVLCLLIIQLKCVIAHQISNIGETFSGETDRQDIFLGNKINVFW